MGARSVALAALASLAVPHASTAPAPRAPSALPLSSPTAGTVGEDTGASPEAQLDPLVSNGLASPTCKGAIGDELSPLSRRNCETSGFIAAPAPTGDYGFDVHIDTGFLGISGSTLDSVVQDLVVTPVWMALVWATHALVVMLEWCFTLELLDSSATVGLGSGLRQMQASLTEPWLVVVLACASVLALYHGLIRRRVADTLGEAALMVAMMVAGLAVIANPAGTVGALGEWADEASLGTLAVAARGSPAGPGRALGSSLGALFTAAIEAPWCYLEFGDVSWCREPSQLDPRLRAAALKIAAEQVAAVDCHDEPAGIEGEPELVPCAPAGSAQAKTLEQSAELLRAARTNGAIFLALPANGAARNSINEQGSLLRTLCESSEASNCHGPTAAQAEFRTSGGTLPRLGGLVLIAAGLVGMLLLLGFLAVRLLLAAVFSLLYLLLAPAIVLAPAFGESGRAVFRKWGAQLLGAVVSKLLFAFLLGVVLAVLGILYKLSALGWWTQWLLTSAFWWGAFKHRHQALGVPGAAAGIERGGRRSLGRRVSEVLETPRRGVAAARWAKGKLSKEGRSEHQRNAAAVGRQQALATAGEQVERTLEAEHRDAHAHAGRAPEIHPRLSAKRSQLARLAHARESALAAGDGRSVALLSHREDRVRGELEREQDALETAQRTVREGEQSERRTGSPHTPARRDAQNEFLAAQAALPARGRASDRGERRDYAALAGLAGYGREEYERLAPRRQREARAEIDRELALRDELIRTAGELADSADTASLGRRERHKANREFDGAVRQRMRERGHTMPASREPRTGIEHWREAARNESSVMRDAHEVAARRKRQLGRGRP